MIYEKPEVEKIEFDSYTFIACSGDTPIGNFTCGQYAIGVSCNNVSWPGSGYACDIFTNGNCQGVYAPPGSMGDGCYAWNLTCSKF